MGITDKLIHNTKVLALAAVLAAPWGAIAFGIIAALDGGGEILAAMGTGFLGAPVFLAVMETVGVPIMRELLKLGWLAGFILMPFAFLRILIDIIPIKIAQAILENRPEVTVTERPTSAAACPWEGRLAPVTDPAAGFWSEVTGDHLRIRADWTVRDGNTQWGSIDDEGAIYRGNEAMGSAVARFSGDYLHAAGGPVGQLARGG